MSSSADEETFRCLGLARWAMEKGGNLPCVMNAANEIAVAAFLRDALGFLQIAEVIEATMNQVAFESQPDIKAYQESDEAARQITSQLIQKSDVKI